MYNSVLDERLLAFNPTLASIIGLNESIVLHQIHYWLNNIEKSENEEYKMYHHHCGRFWVYNTFEQWHNQFPYISIRTLKTTFKNLEDCGLLITGNFNKMGYDRTKWYSIDYNALETLENTHSANIAQSIVSKLPDEKCKNCTTNTKDFSETSHKDLIKCKMLFSDEKRVTDYDILHNQIRKICDKNNYNIKYFEPIIFHFFKKYSRRMKISHPNLKSAQLERIMQQLYDGTDIVEDMSPDDYILLIDKYFNTPYDCDYNLNHFATEGILDNLYNKHIYYGES